MHTPITDGQAHTPSFQNALWYHDRIALLPLCYRAEKFAGIHCNPYADLVDLDTRLLIEAAIRRSRQGPSHPALASG